MNSIDNFINESFQSIPTIETISGIFESFDLDPEIILQSFTNIKNQIDNESNEQVKDNYKNKVLKVFSYCFLHAKDLLCALLIAFTTEQQLQIKDIVLDVQNNTLVATLYYKLNERYLNSKKIYVDRKKFNKKEYYIYVLTDNCVDPHYGEKNDYFGSRYEKNYYPIDFNDVHQFTYDNVNPRDKNMVLEKEVEEDIEDNNHSLKLSSVIKECITKGNYEDYEDCEDYEDYEDYEDSEDCEDNDDNSYSQKSPPLSDKPFMTRKYITEEELVDYKEYSLSFNHKQQKTPNSNIYEPNTFFQTLQNIYKYNPAIIVGLTPNAMAELYLKYAVCFDICNSIYNLLNSPMKERYITGLPKLATIVIEKYGIKHLDKDINFMLARIAKIYRHTTKENIKSYLIPVFLHKIITDYPEILMTIAFFVGDFKYDAIRAIEKIFEISSYEWDGRAYVPIIKLKNHQCNESDDDNITPTPRQTDCYTDEDREHHENAYYFRYTRGRFPEYKKREKYIYENEMKIFPYLDKGLLKCIFLMMYNNYPCDLNFLLDYCPSCYEYVNKNKKHLPITKSANFDKKTVHKR